MWLIGSKGGRKAGPEVSHDKGGCPYNWASAAEYLGTTERHVQRLWHEGRLAGNKVGPLVRFSKRDLDEYLERNRVDSDPMTTFPLEKVGAHGFVVPMTLTVSVATEDEPLKARYGMAWCDRHG